MVYTLVVDYVAQHFFCANIILEIFRMKSQLRRKAILLRPEKDPSTAAALGAFPSESILVNLEEVLS